ncbi:hypothetical protein JCM10512_313 [Bacteroides reticulotermitis JCM 10512]|uniref:PKD-like family protein n=2 Tax=Bacteroides reticulotermitis TaxID=1133319 RepID=W4ULU3_9BACE|nr:hypothetical protein JCM10512_313 [Bacteroides reticulotermitis JCM 10512]
MRDMKRIHLFFAVLFLLGLSGCYEDKGNYDFTSINEVAFDEFPKNLELDQFDQLVINPSFTGSLYDKDESKYEYEWRMNSKVIANTRDLDYQIQESLGSYTLRYTITDKENQTKAFATAQLLINSSTSSDGILVVSNQYGKADFSYLRLDKEGVSFAPMFYNRTHDEPLATNVTQLTQTFVDGYPSYVTKYGGQGIKLIADEGLLRFSNVDLEPAGKIDEQFFLEFGSLYPIPDYSQYKPTYLASFISQWRRTPYGSIMNNEYTYIISEDGTYIISYSRNGAPSIYSYLKDSDYRLSPMSFETGRSIPANYNNNVYASWSGTSRRGVFDENTGQFFVYYFGDMKAVDATQVFPGYKAFYGEDTYQSLLCFSAISNGSNSKLCSFDLNQEIPKVASVDASLVSAKSRFFMLRNLPYVYFNTAKGLYKYNILNVASGIAPAGSDQILSLQDFGYDASATITDISLHRGEKKMLVSVSRYNTDEDGNGSELKGDILEINLEGTAPKLINKWVGVCGAKALVIYKYRTFARNDEEYVD